MGTGRQGDLGTQAPPPSDPGAQAPAPAPTRGPRLTRVFPSERHDGALLPRPPVVDQLSAQGQTRRDALEVVGHEDSCRREAGCYLGSVVSVCPARVLGWIPAPGSLEGGPLPEAQGLPPGLPHLLLDGELTGFQGQPPGPVGPRLVCSTLCSWRSVATIHRGGRGRSVTHPWSQNM